MGGGDDEVPMVCFLPSAPRGNCGTSAVPQEICSCFAHVRVSLCSSGWLASQPATLSGSRRDCAAAILPLLLSIWLQHWLTDEDIADVMAQYDINGDGVIRCVEAELHVDEKLPRMCSRDRRNAVLEAGECSAVCPHTSGAGLASLSAALKSLCAWPMTRSS